MGGMTTDRIPRFPSGVRKPKKPETWEENGIKHVGLVYTPGQTADEGRRWVGEVTMHSDEMGIQIKSVVDGNDVYVGEVPADKPFFSLRTTLAVWAAGFIVKTELKPYLREQPLPEHPLQTD